MSTRFAKFFVLALFSTLIFACSNEPSQSAADEAALPHNNMGQDGNMTEAETNELAAAKGKEATLLTPEELLTQIKSDTASLLVVNFWAVECLKCMYLQQVLQDIQTKHGEDKLHLFAVNLNDATQAESVNLVLRKMGLTSEVIQLKANDGKWRNDISGGWQGAIPALYIKSKDGIKQFNTRNLTKEELEAMLEPLLL